MLEIVERHLTATRNAKSEADLAHVLGDLARALAFRSAYLVENVGGSHAYAYVLDSRPDRMPWWRDYSASRGGKARPEITELLSQGGVLVMNGERFYAPDDPVLGFARQYDLLQTMLVPVTHGGQVIGVGGFCGHPALTEPQKMALQIVVYGLFARIHEMRNLAGHALTGPLTPREREVITLSAQGLTSQEIADQLGMSARTVNQHVDNVAAKLGTKNRAHTVAEAIRHHLLH